MPIQKSALQLGDIHGFSYMNYSAGGAGEVGGGWERGGVA